MGPGQIPNFGGVPVGGGGGLSGLAPVRAKAKAPVDDDGAPRSVATSVGESVSVLKAARWAHSVLLRGADLPNTAVGLQRQLATVGAAGSVRLPTSEAQLEAVVRALRSEKLLPHRYGMPAVAPAAAAATVSPAALDRARQWASSTAGSFPKTRAKLMCALAGLGLEREEVEPARAAELIAARGLVQFDESGAQGRWVLAAVERELSESEVSGLFVGDFSVAAAKAAAAAATRAAQLAKNPPPPPPRSVPRPVPQARARSLAAVPSRHAAIQQVAYGADRYMRRCKKDLHQFGSCHIAINSNVRKHEQRTAHRAAMKKKKAYREGRGRK